MKLVKAIQGNALRSSRAFYDLASCRGGEVHSVFEMSFRSENSEVNDKFFYKLERRVRFRALTSFSSVSVLR